MMHTLRAPEARRDFNNNACAFQRLGSLSPSELHALMQLSCAKVWVGKEVDHWPPGIRIPVYMYICIYVYSVPARVMAQLVSHTVHTLCTRCALCVEEQALGIAVVLFYRTLFYRTFY
jgi:hypothetical protein